MTKTRRLQVLIEEEQWDRLEAAAEARGVSVARVVREAIDASLPGGDDDRRRAAAAILDADRMPVPEVSELRDELDELRGRKA